MEKNLHKQKKLPPKPKAIQEPAWKGCTGGTGEFSSLPALAPTVPLGTSCPASAPSHPHIHWEMGKPSKDVDKLLDLPRGFKALKISPGRGRRGWLDPLSRHHRLTCSAQRRWKCPPRCQQWPHHHPSSLRHCHIPQPVYLHPTQPPSSSTFCHCSADDSRS